MFQVRYTDLALLKKLDKYQPKEAVSTDKQQSARFCPEQHVLPGSQIRSSHGAAVYETSQLQQPQVSIDVDGLMVGSDNLNHSLYPAIVKDAQFRLLERSRMIVKIVPW
jgi:hypothetical protein